MQNLIYEEVDEVLMERKSIFLDHLNEYGGFALIPLQNDSSIIIGPQIKFENIAEPEYRDTMLYNYLEDEIIPYRQIVFSAAYKSENRIITIRQSLFESDDLIETIIYSLAAIFVLALLIFTAINYFGLRKLWQPFYKILDNIKSYDFRNSKSPNEVETDISEFRELKMIINQMTTKMSRDYKSLKEFSENASHEMQTPLAIIRSKLELLLQKKQDVQEMKSLGEAYQATNRLTRLHKSLNLLTRLANNEFTEKKSLQLKPFIEEQIENFNDMIAFKNISLNIEIDGEPTLKVNTYLFEILVSNLVSNAIYHNIEGGTINVFVGERKIEISNDGPAPEVEPEMFFERFKKGKSNSESSGLGLSIAQQICQLNGYGIHYTYEKMHKVEIIF
jgi:signal transduction histidine kinase